MHVPAGRSQSIASPGRGSVGGGGVRADPKPDVDARSASVPRPLTAVLQWYRRLCGYRSIIGVRRSLIRRRRQSSRLRSPERTVSSRPRHPRRDRPVSTLRPRRCPYPGVVARTGLLVWVRTVRSPESVASGACAEAARPPPTSLTAPPTLPALHRHGATEPRSTVSEASGPGGLLPRGRTRTGLEVETTTRSTGPMVTQVPGGDHT